MAAQVTHIVLADKVFDKFFANRDKRKFFVGTCFPDIRYLKIIEKEKTHFFDLNILPSDSDFLAGVKFHAIIDKTRKKCVAESHILKLSPISKHTERSLKLFEDMLLYNSISSWLEYIKFFNEVLPEEIAYGISGESVKKWHKMLQTYFAQQPTLSTTKEFVLNFGLKHDMVDEIERIMVELSADKEIAGILKNLYKDFEIILSETAKYITWH